MASARGRILVVDDEPTIRLTLSYALQSDAIDVVTAGRLDQAEAALRRDVFDVVIVDIRMSGMLGVEGLELLTYIKRYWPRTKVIVMTAHGSDEVQQDAQERGADRYFTKPVDIKDLLRTIGEMGLPVKQ